ncbi:MAG: transglycosylase SLT domain-containing protein [Bacteroidaceae bacterium]|nr:transglycosylase SLT domain-containing protein [Bacteroidaceae bacterium]MCF0185092.1 transglycosylase SLT domain-containing protein [Bacteroidaceae bacterium]
MKIKNVKHITLVCLCFLFGQTVSAQNTITVYDQNSGENEVIDIPENIITNIDSLLSEWYSKTYLDQEEECHMKDENPVFETNVYIDRLHRMPTVIEMPHNEVVQKFIDMYSGRLRKSVSYMLAANNFYMPIFEEALETNGLPLELKYLPIIESALNPKAVSRASAVGLWQFMLTTGKQYGLEVNSLIDERRDPIKSSYAAARYLKDLYAIFGDWHLVIAAYNCGPGNVNKAIHRAGDVMDYWKIYNYLPKETRGYVPSYIAANYIMNYYCDHNICPYESRLPAQTDTLQVTKNLYMEQIEELCGVGMNELEALNPQYRTHLIPGETRPCTLRLPSTALGSFLSQQDTIYNHRINELQSKRKVVAIETVSASKSKTNSNTKSKSSTAASTSKAGGTVHTVKKGDTLGAIASKYHTTVSKLQKLNGIRGTNLQIGQKIRVN